MLQALGMACVALQCVAVHTCLRRCASMNATAPQLPLRVKTHFLFPKSAADLIIIIIILASLKDFICSFVMSGAYKVCRGFIGFILIRGFLNGFFHSCLAVGVDKMHTHGEQYCDRGTVRQGLASQANKNHSTKCGLLRNKT